MRTVGATLLTAEKSTKATPAIRVIFRNGVGGGTVYTYTSTDSPNRVKLVDMKEQPYDDTAILVISNKDHDLPDLRGMYTLIDFGYRVASTNYYPTPEGPAPMWVVSQTQLSKEGDCDVALQLEGPWRILARMEDIAALLGALPPYYELEYDRDTHIYDIIDEVLTLANFDLLPLGIHNDSIIDTLMPDYTVNSVPVENAENSLYRLLNMTKCFMRVERSDVTGLAQFRIIYPNAWTDFHATYLSDRPADTDYQFRQFEWSNHLQLPTRVYTICNRVDEADGTWDELVIIKGEFTVATTNNFPDIVQYHLAETLDNKPDADNRATAIAYRQWMEEQLGRIVVQHDCGLELYDYIKVRDKRNEASYTDYPTSEWTSPKLCVVGSLRHMYQANKGIYLLEITLNGIQRSLPVDKTLATIQEQLETINKVLVTPWPEGPAPPGTGGAFIQPPSGTTTTTPITVSSLPPPGDMGPGKSTAIYDIRPGENLPPAIIGARPSAIPKAFWNSLDAATQLAVWQNKLEYRNGKLYKPLSSYSWKGLTAEQMKGLGFE